MKKKAIMTGICLITALVLSCGLGKRAEASEASYIDEIPYVEEYGDDVIFDAKAVGYVSSDDIYVPAAQRVAGDGYVRWYDASAIYNSQWDKYSCSYIYNQLSAEEKALWDGLDEMCLGYLTSETDLGACTEYVQTTLSVDDMLNVAYMFIYSNPQYYFLESGCSYSYGYGYPQSVAIAVYDEFQSGTERAEYTKQLKASIDEIVNSAANASSDDEKLIILHDGVVNGVEYNYEVTADGIIDNDEEQVWFTQSAYSALCLDYTVCAGYAKAFEMACNASDIDCIAITGSGHAWNKVRINDSWYNVDCTWDDQGGTAYYYYFARNDEIFDDGCHVPKTSAPDWSSIVPKSTLDTGSTYFTPGTFPAITQTASEPVITYEISGDEYLVTITCSTAGAYIYYTTDGTTPSQAATKSVRYTESFTVSDVQTIKAVAVSDTYYDSPVVTWTPPVIYPLKNAQATLSTSSYTYDGTAKTPTVTVKYGTKTLVKGTDYTVTYVNNTKAGTATVTITGKGSYSGSITKNFTINAANISGATATLSTSVYTYDGAAKKPNATVKYGTKTLVKGTDYTITYSSNTAVGTATATVTGKGNYTGKLVKNFTIQLATPTLTSVVNDTTGVTFKWGKVTGAAGYYVYRKTSGGSWTKIATIPSGSIVSYIDGKAVSGTTYIYTVKAYSGSYTSNYNTTGKTIKRLTNPTLSSVTNAASGVTFKWGKVTGAAGYYVYRKTSGGSWTKIATITSGSTLSYTDTKAANGKTYAYTVKAYSGSYTSSYNTTGKTIVRLTRPTISSVTNSASKKITVKWNKNTGGAGYQICYKTGTSSKTVTVSGNTNVSKVISSLTKGKTYTVYVRSYKKVGSTTYYSAWSAAKTVKISK